MWVRSPSAPQQNVIVSLTTETMGFQLAEEPEIPEADARRILTGVSGLDPADVGPRNYRTVSLTLRDDRGKLVGGLLGATLWNWLSIDVLWVDPELRGRGHGRTLLLGAEKLAVSLLHPSAARDL